MIFSNPVFSDTLPIWWSSCKGEQCYLSSRGVNNSSKAIYLIKDIKGNFIHIAFNSETNILNKKNVYLVESEEELIKRRNLEQCVAINTLETNLNKENDKNYKACHIKFKEEYELGLPF